jgi:hypothetical protein
MNYNGASVALRIERQDGAHGFEDPAVPADWTIEQLTARAAPRLRYPTTDVSSGKPLRYSMLFDGVELPRDAKVGDAFARDTTTPDTLPKVNVVSEYENAI